MTISIIAEIIVCLAFALARKRLGFLGYQLAIAFIYLIALSFEQTLDYTMSVYFFFAVIPYANHFKAPGALGIIFALYFVFYSTISAMLNGPVQVISMLVIHYLGPLLLIYVFCNIPEEELLPPRHRSEIGSYQYIDKILIAAALAETVVSMVAMALSPDGRLMLNYQCTSGCIACCCIVLVYHQIAGNHRIGLSVACMLVFLGWSFASGTRGYIVLGFGMAVFVILLLRNKSIPALLACAAMIILCVVIVLSPETIGEIIGDSRFGETTGRRTWENQWAVNLFAEQGLLKDLFGFGIATQYSTQPDAVAAFAGVNPDVYSFNMIYANRTLHNFWYSCILSIGLVGCIMFVALFIGFVKRLSRRTPDKNIVAVVAVFLVIYAFVIWFRWTATGGVLEAAVVWSLFSLTAANKRAHGTMQDIRRGEFDD